jgi:glutamate dehydrogenase/leucine dehydrogenase
MRLSQAMTVKMAVAGAERGGGKAVLAVPELPTGDARRRLLLRYGDLVSSLGGTYRTAGDMNISPADLDVVRERCEWVYGTTGAGGNSGWGTAIGVLHGIKASVEHAFGSPDLAGRKVLVQGAGAVGADLARLLAAEGADVLVSDVDEARAAATGATVVAAVDALSTECDVYAPCAVGGTLDAQSIPRLRCRIVAGSANNQLASPDDALLLHGRGILYAPDYVINAGGVIQLVGLEDHGWDEAVLVRNLARIGDTLRRIYAAADAASITTAEAAAQLAAERIAQKRDEALA